MSKPWVYLEYARIACIKIIELEAFNSDMYAGIDWSIKRTAETLHKRYNWADKDYSTGDSARNTKQELFNKKWGKYIANKQR